MSIISCLCLVTVILLPAAVFGKSEGLAEKRVASESSILGSGGRATIKLSPLEKTYIKNHPVIRVSNELDYPPFDFAIEGQPQGYTIDLLGLLAEKIGIRIEYINGYTWAELVQLFRERKIDLLHSLVKTPERSKFMLFSDRFFRDRQMYITRKENHDITDVTQLYGKTISQGKGWSTTELFQANYPQIPLLIVNNLEEMLSAVAYGKVDATVADEAAATYLIKQKGMSDLKLSGWAKEFDQLVGLNFHFAAQMDAPELISMLNKALASLTVEESDGLKRKWFGEVFGSDLTKKVAQPATRKLPLSPAEKNYLETKKQITMCIDPDWAPFEMINEDGNYVGLTADYFDVFQQMISAPIKLVKTDSWDQSIRFAKARKCDILSLLKKSPERSKYLNFTAPYVRAKVVLIAHKDVVYLDGLESLSGKTLAIVKNYVYEEIVRTSFPDIKIVSVKNLAEGVQKVSDGSVYAAIGSLLTILRPIQELGLTNLKIAGPANLQNNFRIGVRNDEPELVSIFDKAIKGIDQETKNRILRRWYTVSVEESFDYSLLWKIIGAALLIVTMVLYWNRRLSLMARKLNTAKEEADAANRAKSVFLANMSHELRTPLNVILGFTQLLTRDAGLTAEQVANLETIGRSGEHLQALINDVLELSKIEVGRIELTPEPFDLQKTLLGLEEMFRLRAGQKGLSLEVTLDEGLPRQVRTDRNKLRQVLINLLSNAVKFTDQGSVSLRVECLGRNELTGCSQMRFTVTDTGVGIAVEDQSRIFDPFYRADDRVRAQQGTGLGLAISRKFVALLGGALKVSSEVGRGTCFSFDLPVEVISGAQAASLRREERVVGLVDGEPEYRLLVAEDHPDSRNLLAILLKSVGFAVREAANGREALDIWRRWRPQFIWMDISMPEMNGLDAIREIRQLPGGDETVIVGLTAFAFEEDKQMVLAAGGDDYVRKPCTEEEIFDRLEKHLGVRFQYAEDESPSPEEEGDDSPDRREIAAMLDALPEEMLSRFDEAVRLSDVTSIENSLKEIGAVNANLGRFLKKLTDIFAYDEIVSYLDDDEIG